MLINLLYAFSFLIYFKNSIYFFFIYKFWRRQWHPTPVLLPGKPRGWRSLEGCSPWGRWGSDMTEWLQIRLDQISRSVVSDSLWPHESQHARPPCPSPTPRVHSDSRPSSQWCHPAISSSVVPFSSCPQSLQASESFQWVNSSHEVAKVLEFQL